MISIITITCNDLPGLKLTLNSLPGYDFTESIVINGGSDNASVEFLKSRKGIIISEKDEGIADAFNKGIKNSSGDAIMFLNSGDELIDAGYLRDAEEILSNNSDISFIHANLLLVDPDRSVLFMKPPFCNPGRGLPYLHPTMIVRKSVFEQIGNFSKVYKIAMDFDFVVRLVKSGFKGYYKNDKYVVRMDGTGRSIEREFEAIKECYRSLKENNFLTLKNSLGFIIRITLYFIRRILAAIGLNSLLKELKMRKHSRTDL